MTTDREFKIAVFQTKTASERITQEAWQNMMEAGVNPHAAILGFLSRCVFGPSEDLPLEEQAQIAALMEMFIEGRAEALEGQDAAITSN